MTFPRRHCGDPANWGAPQLGRELDPFDEVDLIGVLARTFACTEATALALARRARTRDFPTRAIIVRQGELCSEVLLLVLGRAHATLITCEGRLVRIAEYKPGDIFGGFEPDTAQRAEIGTLELTRIASYPESDFFELAERYPGVALALSRSLVRQLGELAQLLTARVGLSAMGRVYAELSRLARAEADGAIRPAPVLSELAARVQTTRETASRAVSALERRGIVRREDGALVVVARRRLEDLIV